jgi:predicted nucleic acid-binding Zn ribbon protein
MSLRSVEEILKFVTQQPNWETYRQYCHLVECWRSLVSPQVLQHTRPLAISRQVLWVATSSAAWAQNMALQRYSLLNRLNPMLAEPLADIRFSSALWHNIPPNPSDGTKAVPSGQPHPSDLPSNWLADEKDALSNDDRSGTSFDRWVEKIRLRAQNLPSCPRCQAPTPPGELQRWNCCALCANRPERG